MEIEQAWFHQSGSSKEILWLLHRFFGFDEKTWVQPETLSFFIPEQEFVSHRSRWVVGYSQVRKDIPFWVKSLYFRKEKLNQGVELPGFTYKWENNGVKIFSIFSIVGGVEIRIPQKVSFRVEWENNILEVLDDNGTILFTLERVREMEDAEYWEMVQAGNDLWYPRTCNTSRSWTDREWQVIRKRGVDQRRHTELVERYGPNYWMWPY